jgi:hypothetical protein
LVRFAAQAASVSGSVGTRLRGGGDPPGAALAARLVGVFTAVHGKFWDAARRPPPPRGRARALRLIGVLLCNASRRKPYSSAGLTTKAASTDSAQASIEDRRHAETSLATVVPIQHRLARYERPVPHLTIRGNRCILPQPAPANRVVRSRPPRRRFRPRPAHPRTSCLTTRRRDRRPHSPTARTANRISTQPMARRRAAPDG